MQKWLFEKYKKRTRTRTVPTHRELAASDRQPFTYRIAYAHVETNSRSDFTAKMLGQPFDALEIFVEILGILILGHLLNLSRNAIGELLEFVRFLLHLFNIQLLGAHLHRWLDALIRLLVGCHDSGWLRTLAKNGGNREDEK